MLHDVTYYAHPPTVGKYSFPSGHVVTLHLPVFEHLTNLSPRLCGNVYFCHANCIAVQGFLELQLNTAEEKRFNHQHSHPCLRVRAYD